MQEDAQTAGIGAAAGALGGNYLAGRPVISVPESNEQIMYVAGGALAGAFVALQLKGMMDKWSDKK